MTERGKRTASKRSDDEDPDVCKRLAADEQSRTEAAGGVYRRAGKVNSENMHERERKTDDYAGCGTVFGFGRDAENGEHEYEGEYDFNEQGKPDVAFIKTVLTESGIASEQSPEHRGARRCAGELRKNVTDEIRKRDLAANEHRKAYSRIDVAARNVADRIRHGYDNETESESREQIAREIVKRALRYDRRAAGEQHEHERADEFGEIFFE